VVRAVPLLFAGVLAALVFAASAPAGPGVALAARTILVRQPLDPGGVYRLPVLPVRNPGDVVSDYRMTVSYLENTAGRAPEGWFRFAPALFELRPGETHLVEARIVIPADARPGKYEALIGARIEQEGSGASVGVGAAATVRFTVEPSTLLSQWKSRAGELVAVAAPWAGGGVLASLVAGSLLALRRRYAINVRRR
jgi:hypothetical protein